MSMSDEELRKVFETFDADKSGEISPKELVQVLNALWKDEEKAKRGAAYLIVMFDTDGDAMISWEEFKNGVVKYLTESK